MQNILRNGINLQVGTEPTFCENMLRGKKKQNVTHFESTEGLKPKEFAKHFYRRDQSAPVCTVGSWT